MDRATSRYCDWYCMNTEVTKDHVLLMLMVVAYIEEVGVIATWSRAKAGDPWGVSVVDTVSGGPSVGVSHEWVGVFIPLEPPFKYQGDVSVADAITLEPKTISVKPIGEMPPPPQTAKEVYGSDPFPWPSPESN